MFLPKDDYGITRFMPLPSYLEAGKFKLQKDLLNIDSSDEAGGNDKERYIFTYQKIKELGKHEISLLHFAAIGIVVSLSEESCKQILTDIFSGLVELSRRTGKEARL